MDQTTWKGIIASPTSSMGEGGLQYKQNYIYQGYEFCSIQLFVIRKFCNIQVLQCVSFAMSPKFFSSWLCRTSVMSFTLISFPSMEIGCMEAALVLLNVSCYSAHTEIADFPARATGMDPHKELIHINEGRHAQRKQG